MDLKARIYRNGKIKTADPGRPEAEAMLERNGLLLSVGSDGEVLSHPAAQEAEERDLCGRRVIPGIIDSHVHFAAWVEGLQAVDLSVCRSIPQVVEALTERALQLPEGVWVRGMHFDHMKFAEKRLPNRAELDAVPRPVLLTRICFHAHCANTGALEAAGMLEHDDPPRGVQRDGTGRPSGVVLESGADRLYAAWRRSLPDTGSRVEALAEGMKTWAALGITAFNTTSAEHLGIAESFGHYQQLLEHGHMLQRVVVHGNSVLPMGIASSFGNDRLRYGGLKLFADGGFCAQTGAMSFDYLGRPGYRGDLNYGKAQFRDLVCEAHRQNVQVAVHTVGDRAMDQVLDAFENAQTLFSRPGLRHRIIHCYLVRPEQRRKMAALGVAADIQPVFLADEIDIAEAGIPGKYLEISYAWRSLLDDGVLAAAGSDCPAAEPNPWYGFDGAVNRVRALSRTPRGGWEPKQKLSLDEALPLFTRNAARVMGLGEVTGTLEPGKAADFVVLDDDPWVRPPGETLRDIRAKVTVSGGTLTHGKL